MAHKFSKEDLDDQFEQFLRESLSDDSVGNEPKKKSSVLESIGQTRKKELKKHPVPWWLSEDDSDDDRKARFIKQGNEKKSVGGTNEMTEDGEKKIPPSNDQSVKVVTPKPFSSTSHSKALAKFNILEKSLKAKKSMHLTKEESPATDNQTEGICGTNGRFLKSQRLSHPILEVDEDNAENTWLPKGSGIPLSLSRDSLETNDSVVASGPNENVLGIGLDTLEEEEEKERFFANLEKGVSSTIDYSRLNKELDSNDSEVLQAFLRDHPRVKQLEERNEDEPKNHEKSGDYSEDFEDSESKEDNNAEQVVTSEAKDEKTGMLAKVVLLDSQDSTVETQKVSEQQDVAMTEHRLPQDIAADEMNGTASSLHPSGVSGGQTNSDIEALHRAYCHIEHSLGDTDEQRIHAGAMEITEDSIKNASQNKDDCPKNTSTTDSDLPTIEELMKPFRADSSFARGYDLEPASSVDIVHNVNELVSHLPLEEHQNDSSLEKQNVSCPLGQHSVQEEVSVQTCERIGSLHHGASKDNQTEKSNHDPSGQNVPQYPSVVYQDTKLNQVHSNKQNLESVMNKQVMHKNTTMNKKKSLSGAYSSVRSSGYGRSSSPVKHCPAVNEKKVLNEGIKKPALKVKSSARPKDKEMLSGTKIIQTNKPVSTNKNYLSTTGRYSVNSPQPQNKEGDSSLQTCHVSSYSPSQNTGRELYLFKRAQEAEEKLAVAHDLINQLKAAALQKEKEMEAKIMEMKMQHERDFFQLNQEKYVLQTQLNNREDLNKEAKWEHIWDRIPDGGELLKEIQKEVQNQETLLQGYQQENERLYQQVKTLQINNKKNEENMFKENQRLMTELASLKEQVDKNNLLSHGVQNSEPAGSQSFTDLVLELRAAKAAEASLLEERKRLKQEKQGLEVDLEQVKKERDLARAQIASTSDAKSYEMKVMEESYKEEIGRLQKRLQWYAENQELLDKDAARLRGAKMEIDKLQQEVDKLRGEAGTQSAQQKKRLKDRAADAKRIQDLERQVKEMEGILKRRHPNSLPALIYAAATAASDGGSDASSSNTVDFLERRVKKLEAELESKDDDAKKSLRAMEQQFQKIKHQYEKRVSELEQLLAYKLLNDPERLQDKTASQAALEEECRTVNETHQVTVKNLQAEIDVLRNQIAQLELQKKVTEDADIQSLEFQVEQAHAKAKLVRLNQDLVARNKEIQDLTKTVERLQKERRIMLSNKGSGGQTDSKGKPSGNLKKVIFDSKNTGNEEVFPGTLQNKIYQPSAFADSHISEVLQENTMLKKEVEKLSLELSQQRVKSQAGLANSESIVQRTKEDSEEYIAALKAAHQKEIEKILCQHAMEHSASKVAQLNSKISTQEVLISHLQQQLHEMRRDQEALRIAQMREEILQKEMGKLLEELREAKECQRPEMKHFMGLERKVKQLEARYKQREQELQQVIQHTRHTAEVEQTKEIENWKKLALLKNQELEKFRIELDSMLDVLRQLQKQGVVIPAGGSNIPDSYWKI